MPDLTVRTYDPKKIIITFGVLTISGFPEGTFVQINPNGNAFEKSRGADGTVDRINKNAFDYQVNITLKQTALANELLSGLLAADQISNAGVLDLTIKDLNGTTLFLAPQAWIAKAPDTEFSDALSNREWMFETGPGAFLIGSNS